MRDDSIVSFKLQVCLLEKLFHLSQNTRSAAPGDGCTVILVEEGTDYNRNSTLTTLFTLGWIGFYFPLSG